MLVHCGPLQPSLKFTGKAEPTQVKDPVYWVLGWRHDTQHNDIQPNDNHYNDTQRNDIQHTNK